MNNNQISKFLSLILRHKPEEINIVLDEHGWADIDELIKNMSLKVEITRELLEEIVREDTKKRYTIDYVNNRIRANQGHSIKVDVELEKKEPPIKLWHGTGEKYVKCIDEQGLIAKSRLYVHLSSDIETAIDVGKRHGEPIVYEIDALQMCNEGYEFFISANDVWLTKCVPAQYIKKIR